MTYSEHQIAQLRIALDKNNTRLSGLEGRIAAATSQRVIAKWNRRKVSLQIISKAITFRIAKLAE